MPEDPGPPPEPLRQFVRSLGHAERALDLGCGDGRLSAELDAAELTAADVSPVALERARRRLPGRAHRRAGAGRAAAVRRRRFDLVLCAETIEHVRDVQLLLSEIRRVLHPGGALALTTPAHLPLGARPDPLSPHLRFFTRRSLRRLLASSGSRSVAPAPLGHAVRARYSLSRAGPCRPSRAGAPGRRGTAWRRPECGSR